MHSSAENGHFERLYAYRSALGEYLRNEVKGHDNRVRCPPSKPNFTPMNSCIIE